MAKINVSCPRCLAAYNVDAAHRGKSAHCNKCNTAFVITEPAEAVTRVITSALPGAERDSRSVTETDPPDVWKVGDVILGVYEVRRLTDDKHAEKHYAEGGMGYVYRVHHLGWDLDLAVKSPKPETFETERGKQNFERECKTWIDLGLHPNIVSCYYVRRLAGIPRVFAEFVDGGTLQDWVTDGKLYEGGTEQALRRIIDIAIQFAWGLNYAHEQGLVHQDVKSGNVMMRHGVPKVTDFGLTKARGAVSEPVAETTTQHGQRSTLVTWGGMTPGYCSPEQVEAAVQIESGIPSDQRTKLTKHTDIWSWAVSVLEMFCGRPPCRYGGQTAARVLRAYVEQPPNDPSLPAMPDAVVRLLRQCFRRKVSDRPKSMATVADRLKEIYREVTGTDYPRREPVTAELKADGLNNLAVSLLDLGKQAEAEKLLEEAGQLHPWQPQVTHNHALVLWRTGRTSDTDLVAHLEKLCKTRPHDWESHFALGLIQLERGAVQPAVEALQQADTLGGGSDVRATLDRAGSLLPHAPRCVRAFVGQDLDRANGYLSADDRWILLGLGGKTAHIWDVATGNRVLTFEALGPDPACGSLSGDGRWELAAGDDRTPQLREAASGHLATTFRTIAWGASSNCLSADGRWSLSAGDDYTFELFEAATGNLVRTFRGHTGEVNSIALSADGHWALTGSTDQSVKLWEVETGCCLRTFKGHTNSVKVVFLSADARWALSACSGKTVRMWNLELLTSADRRFVAPVLLCQITSSEEAGQAQARFTELHAQARRAVASGDYQAALELVREIRALGGYETTAESLGMWNAVGRRCIRKKIVDAWSAQTFQGHTDQVRSASLTADGRWVLSGSSDRTVRLWEGATGRRMRLFQGHSDSVRSVAISAEGRWALSGSWDKTLRLWDVVSGQCRHVFEGHSNCVNSVFLSADCRWALSGSWDKSLRLWDTVTGQCQRVFRGHSSYVNSVFLSADCRWALSGSEDKTLRLWDTATGRCVRSFEGHADWVQSVCLSPDSRWALSSAKDRELRLWDVESGDCLQVLRGHTSAVTSVFITPDGRWALSASKDKTMRLWELFSGTCQHVFEGHNAPIASAVLSADGRWALSASEDNLLNLWELDWDYEFPAWLDWDEGARPCLETFLALHCPYVEGDIVRTGQPQWNDQDFNQLLMELQYRGLGWLRPEGVRQQLEKMTAQWHVAPLV